ncbi:SCND3 protein, partial [Polyodon spathula]|nr:SCND3 protein [Polyodon spathula]
MPSIVDACHEVLGVTAAKKVSGISNDTVSRRITDIAEDIESQLIERVKASGWFAIQLDELTHISSAVKIVVMVDKITAFKKKLKVWKERVECDCFDMFPSFAFMAIDNIPVFWIKVNTEYPQLGKLAVKILLPFISLSEIHPRIEKLVSTRQAQKSLESLVSESISFFFFF